MLSVNNVVSAEPYLIFINIFPKLI